MNSNISLRKWTGPNGVSKRTASGYAEVSPGKAKFSLTKKDKLFTLGSCFARNIARHLMGSGVKAYFYPNGNAVNPFAAHSILSTLLGENAFDESRTHLAQGKIHDFLMGIRYKNISEWREDITQRRALIESKILDSNILVLTLGLSEVTLDQKTGLPFFPARSQITSRNNSLRASVIYRKKYCTHKRLTIGNHLDFLDKLLELLKSYKSDYKMVLTISPVGLESTFTDQDVIVADMYSKSTLRVAAEEFASKHDDVSYFPSFEMVKWSHPELAYKADKRHVQDAMVSRIMQVFVENYYSDQEVLQPGLTLDVDLENTIKLDRSRLLIIGNSDEFIQQILNRHKDHFSGFEIVGRVSRDTYNINDKAIRYWQSDILPDSIDFFDVSEVAYNLTVDDYVKNPEQKLLVEILRVLRFCRNKQLSLTIWKGNTTMLNQKTLKTIEAVLEEHQNLLDLDLTVVSYNTQSST